jgi:hypothetical protein
MSRTRQQRDKYERKQDALREAKYETIEYDSWYKDYYTGEWESYVGLYSLDVAGVVPKIKRRGFYPKHWARATPSWWNHEFTTIPKRAACRNWEKDVLKAADLEDIKDCPDYGRRPHIFYW